MGKIGIHICNCDAIVISCIDFRFQKYIRNWLDKNMANKTYDYVGFAGGTKNLETILEQIKISARLHNIKQVILINHEDCGAYGAEGTPSKHCQDLYKAKEAILKLFPYMHVDLDYLHLDGEFDPVPQPLPNHHKQYTTLHK